jgi:hypothetical protein
MRRRSHSRAVGTWMSRVAPSDVHGKPSGFAIQNWMQRVVLPIDFAKSLTGTKSARRSVIGGSTIAPSLREGPEHDEVRLAVKPPIIPAPAWEVGSSAAPEINRDLGRSLRACWPSSTGHLSGERCRRLSSAPEIRERCCRLRECCCASTSLAKSKISLGGERARPKREKLSVHAKKYRLTDSGYGNQRYRRLPHPFSRSSTSLIIARIASERFIPCRSPQASTRAVSSADRRRPIIGRTPVGGRPRRRFFCLADIDVFMILCLA